MTAQIQTARPDDSEPIRSLTVCISVDAIERARVVAALDPDGVVIVVPDRQSALELLSDSHIANTPALDVAEEALQVIRLGDLLVDRDRALVTWGGQPVELTHLEIEVLACLAETPGRVWSYERLHLAAWGSHYLGDRDSLHSLVKRLRRKLRAAGVAVDLHAVRGIGFQLIPLGEIASWDTPV